MSDTLECVTSANTASLVEAPGRRRFAILGAASAIVAGLATVLKASPAVADCQGSPCCSLASCTICNYAVAKDRYTCPSGYKRTYWTCTTGGRTYGCGECSKGTSCWTGPFACSVWYVW